ncbi:hypothetical protein LTR62_001274 [Meristemomyces frigidus]|uniref:FAD-binding PCMH-type domain-containing protein n=1 Tax=Meristemomyces frigidus TaxID=1508187 RepID=A0AAN7TJW8_9PEZI|nr:hypothetical protein LTR62_001274 [Meristemomyces frigidus]
MYGMEPKRRFIERALELLHKGPEESMVVVFHRDGSLHLDGLTCLQTVSSLAGITPVADNAEILDCFTPLIAGFVLEDAVADEAIRIEWRTVCRVFGGRDEAYPDHLIFSSPNVMAAFNHHATALLDLTVQVPVVIGDHGVKNREARLHRPASVIRPTEIRHIQQCVRWALNHGVGLTVIGGDHSGHCLRPNVISVDMGAFDQVHILTDEAGRGASRSYSEPLVIVGAGCKSGDIVRKTMALGLTVPLGARPSLGPGLWLQGGIGHLTRLHGLACDAIVGAVIVSVASSQVLYIGCVPSEHRPAGAVRPENDNDLLWAMKGAGTNFGMVVSTTFKACAAPAYSVRKWVIPLGDDLEGRLRLDAFDRFIARKLPRHCSIDAYLFRERDKLCLGVTMFESSSTKLNLDTSTATLTSISTILGLEDSIKTVDGIGLFETEMYMSGMHGGHGSGKTSSFKRCVFLKLIGALDMAKILVAAVGNCPSPLCYLHLLQGGGAVGDVAVDATAFGCRDWDFACVVTGVWPRDQDGTEVAHATRRWVYDVVRDLLPLSSGAYGADLGPDPGDTALAGKAFGSNLTRLARLKHSSDPANKLIILVTGESCAGKDYCAEIWVAVFTTCNRKGLRARTASISNAIKREYAAASGADLERLLQDRAYKEENRSALSTYFQDKVRERYQLPEEQFLNVINDASEVDVLLITGMRDEAPVATFSHLVPDSRLLEVNVKAGKCTRWARQRGQGSDDKVDGAVNTTDGRDRKDRPDFIFNNDTTGSEAAERFCEHYLLPYVHEDLQRLADMVRLVPNFPRLGIDFRDVLGIAQ